MSDILVFNGWTLVFQGWFIINLTFSYLQVIRITNQLKNLSFLNLSHNLFSNVDTSLIKNCTGSSCSNLKTLILNNTKIKFNVVFQLLELFSRYFLLFLYFGWNIILNCNLFLHLLLLLQNTEILYIFLCLVLIERMISVICKLAFIVLK